MVAQPSPEGVLAVTPKNQKTVDNVMAIQKVEEEGIAGRFFGQLVALGVFGFLGPQSLEEGTKVSRDWRDKCAWDCK